MNPEALFERYRELQDYVNWTDEDARRIQSAAPIWEGHLKPLIDDFYAEIDRHEVTRRVITGGAAQVERLKGSLMAWIDELIHGPYDANYVARRWKVGLRHVEIGLDQVYTNMALSRLRSGLVLLVQQGWQGELEDQRAVVRSLNKLLDLDLAIIEDAYQAEHTAQRQRDERLATLGQVAGGVAHELRNPLNVVKTSVYYLRNARRPAPEKTQEHLERIERQVELADGVISALSNFARMPVPDLEALPLENLVQEALDLNSPPSAIDVQVSCPPTLPRVLVDRNQFRIVLGNLLRNAYDAMPQGGRLTVAGEAKDGHVELSVTDNGVGIEPEVLARITEPLYSTKARGLGLGLAITRSILEKCRGSLRVVSQPGIGTTFTVSLASAPAEKECTS